MSNTNTNTLVAKVIDTQRDGVSHNGNPYYDVTLVTRGNVSTTLRTAPNVMFAYACTNSEYREEWHEYELTPAGRIMRARKAD